MKRQSFLSILAPAVVLVFVLLAACANPGSGPDGGPFDELPPRIVSLSPQLGQKNASPKRIVLNFDEYIKVADAQEKIIVSPPQVNEPEIKVGGKRISVVLRDTLKDSTTYTVDFSDAIEDYNEGNPMGNFTYYFSTGSRLDTMEVSGHVLKAEDLSPVKGILVGLHSNLSDTAFRRLPFDRVARTDVEGRFCIKGVAQGEYRIYALNDQDKDFRFSLKGEEIAFQPATITTSSFADVRYDTLWADTAHITAITPVGFTHYLPDDVVLLAFREEGQMRALLKTQRDVPEWFKIYFSAPSDSTPSLRGLNFDEEKLLPIRSEGNDTLTYWVADTALLKQDTLRFELSYLANNDSTFLLETRTDTFELVPRLTYARREKMKEEDLEKWKKKAERLARRGIPSPSTPPREYLRINGLRGRLSPADNLSFTVSEPLARLDTTAVRLELQVNDSTLNPARFLLLADSLNPLAFTLKAEWRPGQQYLLSFDSAAFVSIYDKESEEDDMHVSVGKSDTYGTLFVKLLNADSTMVVQMLADEKRIYRQVAAKNGVAEFYYLTPGKYYLRAFADTDGNGKWTPGDFDEGRRAEALYYFNAQIEVRANWDIDQTWDIKALPLTQQRPAQLRKDKKQKKVSTAERNAERLQKLGRAQ